MCCAWSISQAFSTTSISVSSRPEPSRCGSAWLSSQNAHQWPCWRGKRTRASKRPKACWNFVGLPQVPVSKAPLEKPAPSRTVLITSAPSSMRTFSFFQLRRQGVSGQASSCSSITYHFEASTAGPPNSSPQDGSMRPGCGPLAPLPPPQAASSSSPERTRPCGAGLLPLAIDDRALDPHQVAPRARVGVLAHDEAQRVSAGRAARHVPVVVVVGALGDPGVQQQALLLAVEPDVGQPALLTHRAHDRHAGALEAQRRLVPCATRLLRRYLASVVLPLRRGGPAALPGPRGRVGPEARQGNPGVPLLEPWGLRFLRRDHH